MKYLAIALCLLSTSALAVSGGEGNNTGCNGKGNPNSPCDPSTGNPGGGSGHGSGSSGGAGGAGGAGGMGGTGGSGGAGGSATATGGQGGRAHATATGGAANASGGTSNATANNSVSVGGAYGGYPVNPATAATAYAPPIWGGNSCGLGASAGVQAPLFGISAGTQWEGAGCEWRQTVALVSQINKQAGKEMACSKKEVREAFLRAGEPCQADLPKMADQPAPVPVVVIAPKEYPRCGPGVTDNCRG